MKSILENKAFLFLICLLLGILTSFSLPPYNLFFINFFTFPLLLYILVNYVNKKTIPSLIKKIAFDKKVINEDVNIVLIGKNGGFIKKILIRDLKSILNQIK